MKCPYCNTENEESGVCRRCHAEIPEPRTAPETKREPGREKHEPSERRK